MCLFRVCACIFSSGCSGSYPTNVSLPRERSQLVITFFLQSKSSSSNQSEENPGGGHWRELGVVIEQAGGVGEQDNDENSVYFPRLWTARLGWSGIGTSVMQRREIFEENWGRIAAMKTTGWPCRDPANVLCRWSNFFVLLSNLRTNYGSILRSSSSVHLPRARDCPSKSPPFSLHWSHWTVSALRKRVTTFGIAHFFTSTTGKVDFSLQQSESSAHAKNNLFLISILI